LRLFPPEIEVAPDEGFAPQKDIFGRKAFGDQLTRIVSTLESPSVLLLDAPWGTGKTTFVKMWRGELKKAGIPSVYFDAFANDYQQDAFLAIASQIIAAATNLASAKETALDNFRTHALQAAKILGRATLHIGVRAATAGFVEYQALEKTGEDIINSFGDEATTLIDDILKRPPRKSQL
jgi:predicted KAP-like P-loop ATPase